MSDLWQDIRYGTRRLTHAPGFTAAAVLTLALGIGATSSIFTLVRAVLLDALPYEDPERLVMVRGLMTREEAEDWPISWLDMEDLGAQQKVFKGVAAVGDDIAFNLDSAGELEHVPGEMVSAGYFDLLGVKPVAGRTFRAEEDRPPGEARVAVLGHDLWQRRFGGTPAAVGRTLRLNEEAYTIVGVMPPGFRGLTDEAEIWLPAAVAQTTLGKHYVEMRRFRWLFGVARLAPEVSVEQAQKELDGIFTSLAKEYPDSNEHFSLRLTPLSEAWFGDLRSPLLALLGAAGFVLLIACTNVANLLLARAVTRQKEMSVRAALGAGRGRLIRQLLAESVVLSIFGSVLGLFFASWATGFLTGSGAIQLKSFVNAQVDPTVAAITVVVALACGVFFGLAPALLGTRINLQSGLKAGERSSAGSGRRRFQALLVISEVGLALALLAGAGLMIKGFGRFVETDLGWKPQGVLTLRMDLTGERYKDSDVYRAFVRQLYEKLSAVSGIESVALEGPGIPTGEWHSASYSLENRPEDQEPVSLLRHHVTPGYFKTLGIPLVAGRDFTSQDAYQTAPPAMMVSESMAKRFWPGESAVGKRIKPGPFDGPSPWFTIVGVVADVNHRGLGGEEQSDPDVYSAIFQSPARSPSLLSILVRTDGPPTSFVPQVRQAVRETAPSLTVFDVRTLEDRLDEQTARGRSLVLLMTVFAAIALLLAIIGIYGLLSYMVTQRRREIGIRMALGADRGGVVGMVVRGALVMILAGLTLGFVAVLLLNRFLISLLYGLSPSDPATLAATAVLLLGVALIASIVPALQASRISPVTTLRSE
jgi:predicted permease